MQIKTDWLFIFIMRTKMQQGFVDSLKEKYVTIFLTERTKVFFYECL